MLRGDMGRAETPRRAGGENGLERGERPWLAGKERGERWVLVIGW